MGTICSMIMLVITAYPLTKKELKGRKVVMTLWIITMFFGGGLIPDYFLIRSLGLINSHWALILPGLLQHHPHAQLHRIAAPFPGRSRSD